MSLVRNLSLVSAKGRKISGLFYAQTVRERSGEGGGKDALYGFEYDIGDMSLSLSIAKRNGSSYVSLPLPADQRVDLREAVLSLIRNSDFLLGEVLKYSIKATEERSKLYHLHGELRKIFENDGIFREAGLRNLESYWKNELADPD